MRILITGVRGFAGRHLTQRCLQDEDNDVWGLDRPRESPPGPPLPQRLRLCTADVTDQAAVAQVIQAIQPDAIYHLAARTSTVAAQANPSAILHTNIMGQLHVLQAVIAAGNHARVLVVGSSKEYGSCPPGTARLDEAAPLRPVDPYGVSKVAQDMLGYQYFASQHCHVVRVRPFNHTGPGQSDQFVASAFARQLAEIKLGQRPPFVAVGNLTPVIDFTDVRDIVRAYTLALDRGEPGAVYNIGSGRGVPIKRLLDTLIEVSGLQGRVETRPDPTRQRPGGSARLICDPARFQGQTGWRPTFTLRETLRDLFDYWLDTLSADARCAD